MILEYEDIVIGSCLSATLYAFNNNLPIFFSEPRRPFRFDFLDPSIDVGCVKLTSTDGPIELVTHKGVKVVGPPKELLWERLLFLMSLKGLVPLGDLCRAMRYDGEVMTCSNEYSKIATLNFTHAFYFGDDNCHGAVRQKRVAQKEYICYDWISFHRGGKHAIDLIETGEPFVNQIWFYPSDRIDGKTAVKDACAVSFLTEEQLADFDYSETIARFKTVHAMEANGMKGLFNGYSPTGAPKYYKFQTSSSARHRVAQPSATFTPSQKNILSPQVRECDLLQALPAACVGYNRFLNNL